MYILINTSNIFYSIGNYPHQKGAPKVEILRRGRTLLTHKKYNSQTLTLYSVLDVTDTFIKLSTFACRVFGKQKFLP